MRLSRSRSRSRSRALLPLPLCASLLAGCALEPLDDGEEPPADPSSEPFAAISSELASDPATVSAGGWCHNSWTWNGTHAKTYYPSNGGCSESLVSPLVLIMPGNGFDQTEYHDLAVHLAKNRHIVVVVDTVASPGGDLTLDPVDYQAAATTAWDFVTDFAFTAWSKRIYIDPSEVALIGHSRGGEAVRYLADQLTADPTFEVRAVVNLAGTDHTSKYLSANDARAALYLHGTKDGDVPVAKGVRAYDRTGNEASQNDPAFSAFVYDKTLKLLTSGDHPSFTNKHEGSFSDKPTQRAAAKGYVLAFLKAHLADDWTWYPDYIRGAAVPGGYTGGVTTQTADGLLKRVIDHFEDVNNAANALGGAVTKSASIAWASVNLGLDAASAHATFAMSLSIGGAGSVEWSLPAGKRDASAFSWLSLRIGQLSGLPANGITVQVRNGLVWSPALSLASYGSIAQPTSICDPNDGIPACTFFAQLLEHMATVRVPLDDFGAHNDVQVVRLTFGAGSVGADFVIDSLELAHATALP